MWKNYIFWLDYNHLYVFGKNLHQQEHKVLKKGLKAGLSKLQISNVFNSEEALGNISPPIAIGKFSAVRNGKIRADFYDDSQDIPDPSALDPMQKNLLLLDDCFLGKQNEAEAYYTRGRHNNCDRMYIAQNYFQLPRHTIRENSNFIILFPQDMKNLTHIHAVHCANDISLLEFKQFCHGAWSKVHNFVTIDLPSGPRRMQLYTFSSTILASHGRVQGTVLHLCTPSIANAKRSSTSRELPIAHALHISVG